jgi:antitoxin component YwqK of YwqJK toxin-antitoxin module
VSSDEIYSGTKPTGTWKTFYQADTSIAEITNFSNGVKNGIWQQFFKNGKLKTSGTYVENNLDGLFTGFNPEGQILYKGFYVEGRRAGLWEYYTAAGQLKTKEWYENGEMIKEEVLIPDEPIKDEPLDPSLDPEKSREQGNGGI